MKNEVKNIQAAAYNGARTVSEFSDSYPTLGVAELTGPPPELPVVGVAIAAFFLCFWPSKCSL